MKQSILGQNPLRFADKQKKERNICIAAVCITLAVNVLLTLLRTETNHIWMLSANIAVDIICGWGLCCYLTCVYQPRKRLMLLYQQQTDMLCGEIVAVSSATQRIMGVDCYRITVRTPEDRVLFCPANCGMELPIGAVAEVHISRNVITEVNIP